MGLGLLYYAFCLLRAQLCAAGSVLHIPGRAWLSLWPPRGFAGCPGPAGLGFPDFVHPSSPGSRLPSCTTCSSPRCFSLFSQAPFPQPPLSPRRLDLFLMPVISPPHPSAFHRAPGSLQQNWPFPAPPNLCACPRPWPAMGAPWGSVLWVRGSHRSSVPSCLLCLP